MNLFAKTLRRGAALLFAAVLLAAPVAGHAAPPSAAIQKAAAAPGDSPAQRDARAAVATAWYSDNGMPNRLAGDLPGIDLGKPVQVIDVPANAAMYQYIRNGAIYLGNFFSPSQAAQPDCLGISGTGRMQVRATLPANTALQSIAAPIVDTWTTQGVSVQTAGGCAQVVVNNTTKTKATFVTQ